MLISVALYRFRKSKEGMNPKLRIWGLHVRAVPGAPTLNFRQFWAAKAGIASF